jgi:dynactin-6
VEETAVIVNRSAIPLLGTNSAELARRRKDVMRVGKENHFMIGCRASILLLLWKHANPFSAGVESPSIGDQNTFHPRTRASSAVSISSYCTLAAGTIVLPLDPALPPGEIEELPEYTVVYGVHSDRRRWDGSGEKEERALKGKHFEFLREVLPK